MNIKSLNLRDKSTGYSTIHQREKNVRGNRDARERTSTLRKDKVVQSTPPGKPLFRFGHRLRGVGAGGTRVLELALAPLTLIRHPLITNLIERTRAI